MELSKQEMELFLPLPGLWSKNFFYKMSLIFSKGLKIDFQNRKWNCPNRKWNHFSHFQASDQKTSFTKCVLFVPRGSKLIFKTGNGIVQTGNGIISPTSRPPIKKLLLLNVFYLFQRFQNWSNRKWNFLNRIWNFQNRKWNCQNRKWNYLPTSRPC